MSFAMVMAHLLPWAIAPFAIAGVLAFKQVDGHPIHEQFLTRIGWLERRRRRSWYQPIPLLGSTGTAPVALPPQMLGLELLEVESSWVQTSGRRTGVAVLHDRSAGFVTVVVPVSGDGQFSLSSQDDQDHRVGLWGDALAGFCREGSPVVRICWQEWTTNTTKQTEHAIEARATNAVVANAANIYRDLLTHAAPAAVAHEVLVSITVNISARPNTASPALSAAIDALLDEARLFTGRLENAGLKPGSLLSPTEMVRAVRSRSNPGHHVPASRSLAAAAGLSAGDFGPMAVSETFTDCRVDGVLHRTWWVQGWPRLDVPAAWMDMLLLSTDFTRIVTVVFEPVPPSKAARSVDEAAVALEAAESSKVKHGFRVRAIDRRRREEIEAREHELVSGYGDFVYAGFVHVTANDTNELDQRSADVEQTAAHCGVTLRAVDGRHGAGWVAGLPLGRTLARPAR